MRLPVYLFLLLLLRENSFAQDTLYARDVIKYLTSSNCYGRGYLKNGLHQAEKFITKELRTYQAKPLFIKTYTQPFIHSVNTFPKKIEVKLNGKLLVPGIDFIPDPSACGVSGKFTLTKTDSAHYISAGSQVNISLSLKNKLTYSVGRNEANYFGIELDKSRFKEEPKEIELEVKNKFIPHFESRNIACFFPGTSTSDSLLVFSAHYDHLGGLGNHTFFPGANDNASGVSMLLNLVKYYNTHPCKYKTIFIFFAGEEAGLLGSKYFTENPPFDLKKIKFLINLDLLGTGDDGIMVVNGAIHEKEFAYLNKINSEQHLVKEIKKRGKAANSDHYWFSEKGVPCFFIYTMGGIKAYHDVYDVAKTLPLTDYVDVFRLITEFINHL